MTLKTGPRSPKSNQLVPPSQQCASLVKIRRSVQKITRGNEATRTPTGSAPKKMPPPPPHTHTLLLGDITSTGGGYDRILPLETKFVRMQNWPFFGYFFLTYGVDYGSAYLSERFANFILISEAQSEFSGETSFQETVWA